MYCGTLWRIPSNVDKPHLRTSTPFAFTPVFYEDHQKLLQWQAFIKKSKPDIPVGNLSAVLAEISVFIIPVINSLQSNAPFEGVWLPDQGWERSAE